MKLSTVSDADLEYAGLDSDDFDGIEAFTLEDSQGNEDSALSASFIQDFFIVHLLFLGILAGISLIGRRRFHD